MTDMDKDMNLKMKHLQHCKIWHMLNLGKVEHGMTCIVVYNNKNYNKQICAKKG